MKTYFQYLLDKIDCLLFKGDVVIGRRLYQWCNIPVPKSCVKQSQTHPSIVYCSESWNGYTHWLATTPYPNANVIFENPCIYKAKCGVVPIDFIPIKINPIVNWPGRAAYNSDPELFIEQDVMYCIVRENENDRFLREIKLTSSVDGENWTTPYTIYTSNDPDRQLLSPSFIKSGGEYFIYFLNGTAGIHKKGICTGIEIVKSVNLDTMFSESMKGFFLNKDEVGIEPWHFDLFHYEGRLYMILCGRDSKKKTLRSPMNTYLARSENGKDFIIYEKAIVKHYKSYRPSAYISQGILHLYFSTVGYYRNSNADRSIALTSIPFAELLQELNVK